MEITNKQLRRNWKELWPHLRHIWVFDRRFWLDSLEETEEIIKLARPKIEKYIQFRNEFDDCDDHAHLLIGEMKKIIIDKAIAGEYPPEAMKPRPYGRVAGKMFRGLEMPHSVVIVETRQGTFLLEGHEDRIWKGSDGDYPFYISA